MRSLACAALLGIFASLDSHAGDTPATTRSPPAKVSFTTLTGEKFENVTIKPYDPLEISVFTRTGVKHVRFSDLPPELQKQFGYDADKAAAYLKAIAAIEARRKQDEKTEWTRRQNATMDRRRQELENLDALNAAVAQLKIDQALSGKRREEALKAALRQRYLEGK